MLWSAAFYHSVYAQADGEYGIEHSAADILAVQDDTKAVGRASNRAIDRPSATLTAHIDAKGEDVGTLLYEVWTTNPQVTRALSELDAGSFDVKAARTGYYPFAQVDAAQGEQGRSAVTASIVQPLWDGGVTAAEIREAKANQSGSLYELYRTRLELGLQTAEAFFNARFAEEQAGHWQAYIARLESLLGVIERRADKGVSPSVDVETAVTRLRQAQAGAEANQSVLASARSRLRSLLNREPGRLTWPAGDIILPEGAISLLNEHGVPPTHPERQRALAEVAAQEARADRARASIWPEISVQHSRRFLQEEGDLTPDTVTQLVLQYQTNNGLQAYRGAQAEQQRLLAAQDSLAATEREIANRIREARVARDSARRQFEAQAESAEAADLLVESFFRQFKVGRKAWVEVLNAQREAHDARLQVTTAKRDFWFENARLALEGMLWEKLSPRISPLYNERDRLE
ncbi:TolC family protein [Algiphilus sp. NNCM1]|nr:TolC family protein [Algiphilus acroporae]MCI5062051.1 TolC family protein [Algiphilus sp.]